MAPQQTRISSIILVHRNHRLQSLGGASETNMSSQKQKWENPMKSDIEGSCHALHLISSDCITHSMLLFVVLFRVSQTGIRISYRQYILRGHNITWTRSS